MERSRIPLIAIFSVRGIGVAVSVRISTSARIALIRSLWRTPKRCSSSTISRPRSRSFTSLCSSLCVPIRISILPSAASAGFVSALWRCESGTASQCVPASWRNGRGSYHSVAAPAAWSAPVPLLVYGFPLPGTRRASPLRFCRSRRRRTPACPSPAVGTYRSIRR